MCAEGVYHICGYCAKTIGLHKTETQKGSVSMLQTQVCKEVLKMLGFRSNGATYLVMGIMVWSCHSVVKSLRLLVPV